MERMKYEDIVRITNEILSQYRIRLTVRQIYYRLISPPYQLFPNTQANYKGFDRIITRARENEDVDWNRLEDRARTTLGGEGTVFSNTGQYVDWLFRWLNRGDFERSYWDDQPSYVEAWVEKDALSALFEIATEPFRVVVFPSRGYSSFTKVMEAVKRFPAGKEVVILHFADHDPSGVDMTRDVGMRLRRYGAWECRVKRMALTIEQVRDLALPSNPTKKADARSPEYISRYGDACWELDAVPPDRLQTMVRNAVQGEIDMDAWEETTRQIMEEKQRITEVMHTHWKDLSALREQIKRELD